MSVKIAGLMTMKIDTDVGVVGFDGKLSGVVEVIDQHPPTPRALAEQGSLDFAYYRLLNLPSPQNVAASIMKLPRDASAILTSGEMRMTARFGCALQIVWPSSGS